MIPKHVKKRPTWPYRGRPDGMFAASNGQWAKKIRGERFNFGVWANPKAARELYYAEKEQLESGRGRRVEVNPTRLTVDDLVNEFMGAKGEQLKGGELSARMYDDYMRVAMLLKKQFGGDRLVTALLPSDFAALRNKLAPSETRRANEITWTRTIFRWGIESGIIKNPILFGPQFKRPKARDIRKAKNIRGRKRLYAAHEVYWLAISANTVMQAMILLAINGGFGNTDCAALAMDDVDLGRGVIDNVRHKTGFLRTVTLWPETVAALKEWLTFRPKPLPENKRLFFVTPTGLPVVRVETSPHPKHEHRLKTAKVDYVAAEFNAYVKSMGMVGKTFYDLRHTFRTVAESGAFKERTISRIMGHIQEGIGSEYIHDFSLDKLRAVTEHVRAWYLTGSHSDVSSGAASRVASSSESPAGVP